MKKVRKVLIMIAVVLSVYVGIGSLFPDLRSRENVIQISYIK